MAKKKQRWRFRVTFKITREVLMVDRKKRERTRRSLSRLTIPGDVLMAEVEAPSAIAACRSVFRDWLRGGFIDRQPLTSSDGGFQGVRVEVLRQVE